MNILRDAATHYQDGMLTGREALRTIIIELGRKYEDLPEEATEQQLEFITDFTTQLLK